MSEQESDFSFPATGSNSNAWMLTFADLLSLMLTFFVLLYAMSVMEEVKFKQIAKSLMQQLNPLNKIEDKFTQPAQKSITRFNTEIAVDLDYLYTILTEKINDVPELSGTRILRLDDRIVITLPSDRYFAAGDAYLTSDAKSAVFLLGEIVSTIGNSIDVNGHTDPAPTSGTSYPSNWELSLARAATVAGALRRSGYLHPIHVFGYGESRYDELPSNRTTAEKDALARRVDIAIRATPARNTE